MADDILLENGSRYRGRFVLEDPIGAATPQRVAEALDKVGFKDVIVWLDQEKLPADWPKDKTSDESDLMQRMAWAEGTWAESTRRVPTPVTGTNWHLYDLWKASGEEVYDAQPGSTSPYLIAAGIALGGVILGAMLFGSRK